LGIAREVETRVACALWRGDVAEGGLIPDDVVDGELKVVTSSGSPPEERAAA
jgi:hypothetical protein